MKKIFQTIMFVVAILAIVLVANSFFVVDETQQVVITEFGKPIRSVLDAGLHVKVPFIQQVTSFEKRILQWDGDATEIPTSERNFIWVDAMARWRIADPLKFMQSVGNEIGAQTRLDDIIDASIKLIVSSHTLPELVRNSNRLSDAESLKRQQQVSEQDMDFSLKPIQIGRAALTEKIFERSAESVKDYGIELVDVKIKRINYRQDVQKKVYDRMISERKRAAEKFRSEGQGKKAEIEGQMQKELEQIRSEAYKTAQEIRGKTDAQAIQIYADAYNHDPEFYAFLKTLDAYRTTINDRTTLILSTDNEVFEYLGEAGYVGE